MKNPYNPTYRNSRQRERNREPVIISSELVLHPVELLLSPPFFLNAIFPTRESHYQRQFLFSFFVPIQKTPAFSGQRSSSNSECSDCSSPKNLATSPPRLYQHLLPTNPSLLFSSFFIWGEEMEYYTGKSGGQSGKGYSGSMVRRGIK